MKRILTAGLCICCLLQPPLLKAQDISNMTISIDLKNATLTEAFNKIEQLTMLRFNYKTADVAAIKGITYQQQKASVKKVLTDLLLNTPLQFEQVQQYILIKKRQQQPPGKKGKIYRKP